MVSPLQVSGWRCSSVVQQFYYTRIWYDPRVVNVQGFQTARYSYCAYASPVSVAHHSRESVDYIADTTRFDLLSSVSPLIASGSTFKFVL